MIFKFDFLCWRSMQGILRDKIQKKQIHTHLAGNKHSWLIMTNNLKNLVIDNERENIPLCCSRDCYLITWVGITNSRRGREFPPHPLPTSLPLITRDSKKKRLRKGDSSNFTDYFHTPTRPKVTMQYNHSLSWLKQKSEEFFKRGAENHVLF